MPADSKKTTTAAASKKVEKEIADAPVAEKKAASKAKKAEEPVAAAPAAAPEVAEKKKSSKKKEEAAPAAAAPSSQAEEEAAPSEPKQRRVVTKESVQESFDVLQKEIASALETLGGEGKAKFNALRFVRSMARQVKTLRSDVNRVAKVKTRSAAARPANSGFMKPVAVSKDLAKFTGWDASQLRSRVDVTKYICQYVKDNNLQDPSDRRNIIPDAKLAKLLDYDAKKEKDANGNVVPLTYYYMQRKLKAHFPAEAK